VCKVFHSLPLDEVHVFAVGYNEQMDPNMPYALKKALSDTRVRQIPKGQIIIYEGDPTVEVYVIKSGVIKLHHPNGQGDKVLHLLKFPAVLPLAYFSGGNKATRWTYTALTDCELYVFRVEVLRELMLGDAQTVRYLVNHFSEDVHEVLVRLESLGKSDMNAKLGSALRYLAAVHGKKWRGAWVRIPFTVTNQLLADMIGVTRESASTAMKTLADKNIARYPRFAQLEINVNNLHAFIESLQQGETNSKA